MTGAARKRRKALVFIDYDMLVRHFVNARAFADLEKSWDVKYVFHTDSTSQKQGIFADVDALGLADYAKFDLPRRRMGEWDWLYSVTVLHNHRDAPHFKLRRELMADARGWRLTYQFQAMAHPWVYPLARRILMSRMGVYKPLDDFIAAERPDAIFHPSILAGYFINELNLICPARGIPLVVMMNSWDNPANKSMNTGIPDRLVVWGPQTKRHAVEYMKMPADRVLEFGAAQFQVYRQTPDVGEAELRRRFAVPDGIPIVLYAGVSKSVNETDHLLALDRAISEGRIPRCHIVYRPHPWRGPLVSGERDFFDVPYAHVTMDPHMADFYRRAAAGKTKGFELSDYSVTAHLLRLVKGVVSPLSTMLLEGAMHGVPVVMFWPDGPAGIVGKTIDIGTRLPHFAEFWGCDGIQVCTRAEALAESCKLMLTAHQSDAVRKALQAHARGYVVMDGPSYSERLALLADEIVDAFEKKRIAA